MSDPDAVTVRAELARHYGHGAWTAYRSERHATLCLAGDGRGAVGVGSTWTEAICALAYSRLALRNNQPERRRPWLARMLRAVNRRSTT